MVSVTKPILGNIALTHLFLYNINRQIIEITTILPTNNSNNFCGFALTFKIHLFNFIIYIKLLCFYSTTDSDINEQIVHFRAL